MALPPNRRSIRPRSAPRIVMAGYLTAVLLPVGAPAAPALEVLPDRESGVCRISGDDAPAGGFWDRLHAEAVERRLAELDRTSPGLGGDIADYVAGHAGTESANPAPPDPGRTGELQRRLGEAGAAEGLGMFLPQDDALSGTGAPETTTYTPAEARAAAGKIPEDPAELAQRSLDALVADHPGVRLHEIERELFAAHREEYVREREKLREDLLACSEELSGPRVNTALGLRITGVIVVAGALVMALNAWRNSRRGSRHSR